MTASKIVSLEELQRPLAEPRRRGCGVMFASGCFGLHHVGHARYLEAVKREGNLPARLQGRFS